MNVLNSIHIRQPRLDESRLSPQIATIGFFDGVHAGHRYLIGQVTEAADRAGMESMVITFDRHPRRQSHPPLLTSLDAKLRLLSETPIRNVAVLRFDEELAALSAYDFMRQILREQLSVSKLVLGYDNRFGHNRAEGFDDYVRYGQELGIAVVRSRPFVLDGATISSSMIRRLIEQGELERANRSLGYPYRLAGRVVTGFQEGRKIGFPTANLEVEPGLLIPEPGVYVVKVRMEETTSAYWAMMNIGRRPTYGGDSLTLEVHILDFRGDIYGSRLSVSFLHRIREERKFASPELLTAQLQKDREVVERFRGSEENFRD